MQLKVFNNGIGSYNILNPSQKTFEFSMGLVGEDKKIISVDGVNAIISYSGDPDDEYYFSNPIDNIEDVFFKCFEYADRVWSTVNYKAQCLLFAKLYCENHEYMDTKALEKHREDTQKKIEQLQKELKYDTILPNLTYAINNSLNSAISKLNKSISFKEKELLELKEDSESYSKVKKRLDDLKNEVEKYNQYYISEPQ